MYIILVYDIGEKRVGKMLKLCRRYLNWIQNSVFEGDLTAAQLNSLKYEANELMKEHDSLIIFKNSNPSWLEKEVIGEERAKLDFIL